MSQSLRCSVKILAGLPFLEGPNRTQSRRPGVRLARDETEGKPYALTALALVKEVSVMISKGLSGPQSRNGRFVE